MWQDASEHFILHRKLVLHCRHRFCKLLPGSPASSHFKDIRIWPRTFSWLETNLSEHLPLDAAKLSPRTIWKISGVVVVCVICFKSLLAFLIIAPYKYTQSSSFFLRNELFQVLQLHQVPSLSQGLISIFLLLDLFINIKWFAWGKLLTVHLDVDVGIGITLSLSQRCCKQDKHTKATPHLSTVNALQIQCSLLSSIFFLSCSKMKQISPVCTKWLVFSRGLLYIIEVSFT